MIFRDGIPFDELMRAFRPDNDADRLQLSDLFVDAGRHREAILLRALKQRIWVKNGVIETSILHYFFQTIQQTPQFYLVYVVWTENLARFMRIIPDAKPINRRKACHLGYYLPMRQVKSGRPNNGLFVKTGIDAPTSVEAAIEGAITATMDMVVALESGRDERYF